MNDIKVTQADREAGKEWWRHHLSRNGESDDLATAFARHRIEAQRPLLEALERERGNYDDLVGKLAEFIPIRDTLTAMQTNESVATYIRAAIKQAKGEQP